MPPAAARRRGSPYHPGHRRGSRQLGPLNPRAAALIRLRFFAGLTEVAAADALDVSERTARRDWTFARAWLYDALNE